VTEADEPEEVVGMAAVQALPGPHPIVPGAHGAGAAGVQEPTGLDQLPFEHTADAVPVKPEAMLVRFTPPPEAVEPADALQPPPQDNMAEGHGAAATGAQLCELNDSVPPAQLAVSVPVKPDAVFDTETTWPLDSVGTANVHEP